MVVAEVGIAEEAAADHTAVVEVGRLEERSSDGSFVVEEEQVVERAAWVADEGDFEAGHDSAVAHDVVDRDDQVGCSATVEDRHNHPQKADLDEQDPEDWELEDLCMAQAAAR